MTDELKTLFPGRDIVIKGETIRARPFYFGELPQAAAIMVPAAMALAESGFLDVKPGKDGRSDVGMVLPENWIVRLIMVMQDGGEQVMRLCAFVAKKDRSWFDDVYPDEGINLVRAVIEENYDFFTSKVLPMFPTFQSTLNSGPNESTESEAAKSESRNESSAGETSSTG